LKPDFSVSIALVTGKQLSSTASPRNRSTLCPRATRRTAVVDLVGNATEDVTVQTIQRIVSGYSGTARLSSGSPFDSLVQVVNRECGLSPSGVVRFVLTVVVDILQVVAFVLVNDSVLPTNSGFQRSVVKVIGIRQRHHVVTTGRTVNLKL